MRGIKGVRLINNLVMRMFNKEGLREKALAKPISA